MLKEFVQPNWMRIVLFPLLLLFMPALLRTCNETCTSGWHWLAGIKLLSGGGIGELTFLAMLLWFATAYFLACLITINYEYLMDY